MYNYKIHRDIMDIDLVNILMSGNSVKAVEYK